ncbi:MAG: SRPBCC domain-containing protein [Bacteroidota bacterium]
MPDTPIITERILNAPVEKVWSALTSKEEMDKWYFKIASFKPEVGFVFQFTGEGRKGETYIHHCEVKEVVPMKKLSYTWRYEGIPGNSLVEFELFREGDKTKIKLTHTGLETFGTDNPDFAVSSFTEGWKHIIGTSLPEYLEKTRETKN